MSQMLGRIHRSLIAAARHFGDVESTDGYAPEIQDAGAIGAPDERTEPFASAFRLVLIEPMVGAREFTVTISETTRRR